MTGLDRTARLIGHQFHVSPPHYTLYRCFSTIVYYQIQNQPIPTYTYTYTKQDRNIRADHKVINQIKEVHRKTHRQGTCS